MYVERTATLITVQVRPYLEFSYLRTLPGIVKVIELILDFLIFICVLAGPYAYYGGVGWACFVSITAFTTTLSLLLLYLFHVVETYNIVPWLLIEMIYCIIWTAFYFLTGCVLAATASNVPYGGAWVAASLFSFGAMFCYGFDVFLKYVSWRDGESPQITLPTVISQQQQSTSVH